MELQRPPPWGLRRRSEAGGGDRIGRAEALKEEALQSRTPDSLLVPVSNTRSVCQTVHQLSHAGFMSQTLEYG
ncbi:hypothetical protein EYF80_003814 [Liparis tanakae]|uniref:Uncharacterized protein n=1 Tax=Liparis tanakae TaxID=230148 RepID=A0A4Z2J794_9TELE|nr:hypothetical protein EYF80_003814 [Liparis tanakae]